MKFSAPLALALCLAATLSAQTPAHFTDPANLGGERVAPRDGHELPLDQGASGLQQLLRKLNTRASILNIVAHPDDEDGGMLTLYARGLGARVADLSLTRGEGGQNAMTGDFEDALGLLRTQELLANDRYTGVQQFFGTEVDFGFSKTKAESFAKWGHQRVLYDVVRAIRIFRPLVVTSSWIGNVTDGHGQHQVSGEIAQEAFKDAGDPKIFPELTAEGILPWQPLKMYARVPRQAVTARGLYDYATGQYTPARFTNYITGEVTDTIPSTDIVIHEGTVDPLLTTCAANPSDLPPALRASSNLSSRPEARSAGAERSAFRTATDCRPLTYVQFARIGLGLQRTQIGPGVRNAPSGAFDVPYHLYGSRIQAPKARSIPAQGEALGTATKEGQRAEGPLYNPALASQPNFFDGIDTSLDGILSLDKNAPLSDAAWEHITQSIAEAQRHFDPQHPERIAPLLADALANMDLELNLLGKSERPSITSESILHELRIKRVQLNDALALALGVQMRADIPLDKAQAYSDAPSTSPADVVAGKKLIVRIASSAVSPSDLRVLSAGVNTSFGITTHSDFVMTDGDDLPGIPFPKEGKLIRPLIVQVPVHTPPTKPYFWRGEQPFYDLLQPDLRNAPATPPPFVATMTLSYERTKFEVTEPVVGLHTYAGGKTALQSISITPSVSLAVSPAVGLLFGSRHSAPLQASVRSTGLHSSPATVSIQQPEDWTVNPRSALLPTVAGNYTFRFTATAPAGLRDLRILEAIVQTPADSYTEGFRAVGYPGLISTNYFTPAIDRIVPVDLKLPPPNQRRIGYLPGTGDAVPEALASIGLKPAMLTVADLTPAKLSQFDTVILGVRTYAAHHDLHGTPTQALLDFARSGGNVVVQYQTGEFTAADAPYPLDLGSDEKVVDETEAVHLLATNSPLLHRPNTINPADFNGWIEERGHGFLGSWDSRYTALTETHDPGQAPQKGGLITTQLGNNPNHEGRWTYCAFALYRQLPEAVPGAYRLFVDLLTPNR